MSDHPTAHELAGLGRGEVSPERSKEIIFHVLAGCSGCLRVIVKRAYQIPGEPERPPADDAEYDAAIERVFNVVRQTERKLRRRRAEVRKIVAGLEEHGIEALYRLTPRQVGLPLIEALLERSWAVRHDAPPRMVELAELARLALRRLDASDLTPDQVADTYCRVWAELGNAYRVADELEQAETAFANALEWWHKGSKDTRLLAHLLDLMGSFHGTCRRFGMACMTLDNAHKLHLRHRDRHLAGRALITKGIYTGYANKPLEAIRLIERGLGLIVEDRDPALVFQGVHNRIHFLIDCRRFEEARKALFLNRARCTEDTGKTSRLKVRWLEGRIDAGMAQVLRAEEIFREVIRGLSEVEMGFHSALAALDLAETILRQGRVQEAREIVIEAAKVFAALKIHREALVAVLFLRDCFVQETTPAAKLEELLSEVIAFLRRAERDPNARFDPPLL